MHALPAFLATRWRFSHRVMVSTWKKLLPMLLDAYHHMVIASPVRDSSDESRGPLKLHSRPVKGTPRRAQVGMPVGVRRRARRSGLRRRVSQGDLGGVAAFTYVTAFV